MPARGPRYFAGLTRNAFLLAITSLFADISTEMLYPVIPLFLTQVLAAPATVLGLVEGIADATQNIAQGFSGWMASRFRRNKPLALAGYALAAIAKPCMGLSLIWPQFLGARFADRLGAGTRSAPRDALIAGSVEQAHRGKAFGLEGAGDHLGAVLGPLIALLVLSVWQPDLRWLFYLAAIPAAIAFVMVLPVTEPRNPEQQPVAKIHLGELPPAYWRYLAAVGLFGIGNSTNAFLILRIKEVGLSTEQTILVYAAFNLVAALASLPAGSLSDRFGRRGVLTGALAVFALAYAGFAATADLTTLMACFVFCGLFQGTFRTVGKAAASDIVPEQYKALGIGLYASVVGLTALAASAVGGQLWTSIGPSATFWYGAVLAAIACPVLYMILPGRHDSYGKHQPAQGVPVR